MPEAQRSYYEYKTERLALFEGTGRAVDCLGLTKESADCPRQVKQRLPLAVTCLT